MKKAVLILFTAVSIFMSCSENESRVKTTDNKTQGKRDQIFVVSTITIINDIVKNIGREKVKTHSICGVGIDPHTYHATPVDPKLVSKSDIIFINGLNLEHWMEEMIKFAGGAKRVETVTTGITPLTDDKGFGDPDPHAWFDARNIKVYADNIAKGLISIDPENEAYYKSNLEQYILAIDSLHEWILREINSIPEDHRVLITSHDAFRYFGKAYGMDVKGLQGISTEAKVQTEDVKNLIDFIKSKNLKSVFIETSVNPKLLEQISSETNANIGGTLFSDSIGNEDSPEGTYIGAVRHNVNTIVNALK
ncbi:MAG: Manganese-binding lipoprotein MntA [Ignavibacteria bacterium]|nr:Manganese-binding lipoprotein MntA [Ignavibacteria bacterium]